MEEKWLKMPKSDIFWAKIAQSYWYHFLVPVPMMQWASGTGTTQSGSNMGLVLVPVKVVPVPLLPATLFLHVMQF